MVAIKEPQTLVRLGRYDSPLAEAVKNFSEKLEPTCHGLGNTVKYFLFKNTDSPYLLIVAQQKDFLLTPGTGHNTSLSITSYSHQLSEKVAYKFEKETGISLDIDVPEQLKRHYDAINLSFRVFEERPEAAAQFLKYS